MPQIEFLIPLIFILAAIFYALLGLYAWRKRPAAGVVSFAWFMLSLSIWSFTYGLEVFVPQLAVKLLVLNIEYIGIAWAPVFVFFFALEYTGRSHLIKTRFRTLVWAFPVLALLLVWTNPLHHLMWDMEKTIRLGALSLLSLQYGFAFWAHIFLIYVIVFTSGILLIMDFVQRPGAMRLHISFVVLGLLFSFMGTVSFVFGFSPIPGLDFTPLYFLPAAIGLAWATLRYRLSEVLPLEHLTVLENMHDGVIVLNDQKRILYINQVIEDLLDLTEDEAIGQPFHEVVKAFSGILNSSLSENGNRIEIQTNIGAEARTFEVAVSSMVAARRETSNIVISLHDVTERKEKEEELSRRGSIMSAISRAAERFLKAIDWEDNIPAVLNDLGSAADVSCIHVLINTLDENGKPFANLRYEWSTSDIAPQITAPNFKNIDFHKTKFSELAVGRSVWVSIDELPEKERELFSGMGSYSMAAIPIFVNDAWWASIFFHECRHERLWADIELEAFQTTASIFSAAETQSRTEKKLVQRQLAMELLQDIVSVSLQAASMREMGETVANRLAHLIQADGCFLTLWDDDRKQTFPFAAYGAQKQIYAEVEIEPEEVTFTRSVLELERTLVIEDTGNTPYASPSITRSFPSKSLLALPLIAMEKKLGAVLVSFDHSHHFEMEEVQICEQAAALIALALEKFQAVEDARRRADTSETLRKAGMAVAERSDLHETVSHILEQLKRMVLYDSASVQLLGENELHIIGGSGWNDPKEIADIRFPIPSNNPNTVVIETGRPYYLPDAGKDYEQFNQPPHDHIRSWLGVPMIVQEKTIGLMAIDSKQTNGFSEQDIMVASEFANQVAIALENARILQETQTQAITDALTGIHNRRGLFQMGEFEFQRARRIQRPFSILMFDIDHFKKINDTHGHIVGDQILQQLARRCAKTSRATDLVGRYGGEEFVILLTETNLEAAKIIGERLRQSIQNTPFKTDAGELIVTTSIGITESTTSDTLATLIKRADSALYKAKNAGRNCVVVD